MFLLRFLLLVNLALLVACGEKTNQTPLLRRAAAAPPAPTTGCPSDWRKGAGALKINRRRWQTKANKTKFSYDFVFSRLCFCLPSYTGPFAIKVRKGVVVSPTNSTFPLPTMDGLYDILQSTCYANCPSQGAASCIIKYNNSTGAIQQAFVDHIKMAADDEITYQTSNVTFMKP